MRRILLLMLPALLLFTATNAGASTIAWNGAGANDFFDWSQLGPEFSFAPSGFTAVSNLARNATLADGGVGFINCQQQPLGIVPCQGNFVLDDWLLVSDDGTGSASTIVDISFASTVAAVGSQVASNNFGAFTVRLDVFAGATNVGTFFATGFNDGGVGGPINPFLGALSDAVDITRAVFTLTSQVDDGGEILGTLRTSDTPFTPGAVVPEPATLGLVGAGVLAAIRRRRQRR